MREVKLALVIHRIDLTNGMQWEGPIVYNDHEKAHATCDELNLLSRGNILHTVEEIEINPTTEEV